MFEDTSQPTHDTGVTVMAGSPVSGAIIVTQDIDHDVVPISPLHCGNHNVSLRDELDLAMSASVDVDGSDSDLTTVSHRESDIGSTDELITTPCPLVSSETDDTDHPVEDRCKTPTHLNYIMDTSLDSTPIQIPPPVTPTNRSSVFSNTLSPISRDNKSPDATNESLLENCETNPSSNRTSTPVAISYPKSPKSSPRSVQSPPASGRSALTNGVGLQLSSSDDEDTDDDRHTITEDESVSISSASRCLFQKGSGSRNSMSGDELYELLDRIGKQGKSMKQELVSAYNSQLGLHKDLSVDGVNAGNLLQVLNKQLVDLEDENEDISHKLTEAKSANHQHLARMKDTEAVVVRLEQRIVKLETDISQRDEKIGQLKGQIENFNEQLNETAEESSGKTEKLEILNQQVQQLNNLLNDMEAVANEIKPENALAVKGNATHKNVIDEVHDKVKALENDLIREREKASTYLHENDKLTEEIRMLKTRQTTKIDENPTMSDHIVLMGNNARNGSLANGATSDEDSCGLNDEGTSNKTSNLEPQLEELKSIINDLELLLNEEKSRAAHLLEEREEMTLKLTHNQQENIALQDTVSSFHSKVQESSDQVQFLESLLEKEKNKKENISDDNKELAQELCKMKTCCTEHVAKIDDLENAILKLGEQLEAKEKTTACNSDSLEDGSTQVQVYCSQIQELESHVQQLKEQNKLLEDKSTENIDRLGKDLLASQAEAQSRSKSVEELEEQVRNIHSLHDSLQGQLNMMTESKDKAETDKRLVEKELFDVQKLKSDLEKSKVHYEDTAVQIQQLQEREQVYIVKEKNSVVLCQALKKEFADIEEKRMKDRNILTSEIQTLQGTVTQQKGEIEQQRLSLQEQDSAINIREQDLTDDTNRILKQEKQFTTQQKKLSKQLEECHNRNEKYKKKVTKLQNLVAKLQKQIQQLVVGNISPETLLQHGGAPVDIALSVSSCDSDTDVASSDNSELLESADASSICSLSDNTSLADLATLHIDETPYSKKTHEKSPKASNMLDKILQQMHDLSEDSDDKDLVTASFDPESEPEGPQKWRKLSMLPLITVDPRVMIVQHSLANAVLEFDILSSKHKKVVRQERERRVQFEHQLSEARSDCRKVQEQNEVLKVRNEGDQAQLDMLKDNLVMLEKRLSVVEVDRAQLSGDLLEAEGRLQAEQEVRERLQKELREVDKAQDLRDKEQEERELEVEDENDELKERLVDVMGQRDKLEQPQSKPHIEIHKSLSAPPAPSSPEADGSHSHTSDSDSQAQPPTVSVSGENSYLSCEPSPVTESPVTKPTPDSNNNADLVWLEDDHSRTLASAGELECNLVGAQSEKTLLAAEVTVLRDEYQYLKKGMEIMEKFFNMGVPRVTVGQSPSFGIPPRSLNVPSDGNVGRQVSLSSTVENPSTSWTLSEYEARALMSARDGRLPLGESLQNGAGFSGGVNHATQSGYETVRDREIADLKNHVFGWHQLKAARPTMLGESQEASLDKVNCLHDDIMKQSQLVLNNLKKTDECVQETIFHWSDVRSSIANQLRSDSQSNIDSSDAAPSVRSRPPSPQPVMNANVGSSEAVVAQLLKAADRYRQTEEREQQKRQEILDMDTSKSANSMVPTSVLDLANAVEKDLGSSVEIVVNPHDSSSLTLKLKSTSSEPNVSICESPRTESSVESPEPVTVTDRQSASIRRGAEVERMNAEYEELRKKRLAVLVQAYTGRASVDSQEPRSPLDVSDSAANHSRNFPQPEKPETKVVSSPKTCVEQALHDAKLAKAKKEKETVESMAVVGAPVYIGYVTQADKDAESKKRLWSSLKDMDGSQPPVAMNVTNDIEEDAVSSTLNRTITAISRDSQLIKDRIRTMREQLAATEAKSQKSLSSHRAEQGEEDRGRYRRKHIEEATTPKPSLSRSLLSTPKREVFPHKSGYESLDILHKRWQEQVEADESSIVREDEDRIIEFSQDEDEEILDAQKDFKHQHRHNNSSRDDSDISQRSSSPNVSRSMIDIARNAKRKEDPGKPISAMRHYSTSLRSKYGERDSPPLHKRDDKPISVPREVTSERNFSSQMADEYQELPYPEKHASRSRIIRSPSPSDRLKSNRDEYLERPQTSIGFTQHDRSERVTRGDKSSRLRDRSRSPDSKQSQRRDRSLSPSERVSSNRDEYSDRERPETSLGVTRQDQCERDARTVNNSRLRERSPSPCSQRESRVDRSKTPNTSLLIQREDREKRQTKIRECIESQLRREPNARTDSSRLRERSLSPSSKRDPGIEHSILATEREGRGRQRAELEVLHRASPSASLNKYMPSLPPRTPTEHQLSASPAKIERYPVLGPNVPQRKLSQGSESGSVGSETELVVTKGGDIIRRPRSRSGSPLRAPTPVSMPVRAPSPSTAISSGSHARSSAHTPTGRGDSEARGHSVRDPRVPVTHVDHRTNHDSDYWSDPKTNHGLSNQEETRCQNEANSSVSSVHQHGEPRERSDRPYRESSSRSRENMEQNRKTICMDRQREIAGRPREKSSRTRETLERARELIERPRVNSNRSNETSSRSNENSSRSNDSSSRPMETSSRTRETSDQPRAVAEGLRETSRPRDSLDRTRVISERPRETSSRHNETLDQPMEVVQQLNEISSRTRDTSDRSSSQSRETSNRPKENLDRTTEITDRQIDISGGHSDALSHQKEISDQDTKSSSKTNTVPNLTEDQRKYADELIDRYSQQWIQVHPEQRPATPSEQTQNNDGNDLVQESMVCETSSGREMRHTEQPSLDNIGDREHSPSSILHCSSSDSAELKPKSKRVRIMIDEVSDENGVTTKKYNGLAPLTDMESVETDSLRQPAKTSEDLTTTDSSSGEQGRRAHYIENLIHKYTCQKDQILNDNPVSPWTESDNNKENDDPNSCTNPHVDGLSNGLPKVRPNGLVADIPLKIDSDPEFPSVSNGMETTRSDTMDVNSIITKYVSQKHSSSPAIED